MAKRIGTRPEIGHVHLSVADLERALGFYRGVLGFDVVHRVGESAFLSTGGESWHIGLNTRDTGLGEPPSDGPIRAQYFAIRYPDRASLGDALRRLTAGTIAIDRAIDHGVSQALYVRDPDGNALELYWDRPRREWPRDAGGAPRLTADPLDLDSLASAATIASSAGPPVPAQYAPLPDPMRQTLRGLRGALLQLHKVLLDDTRVAYEMDRGRIGSNANLLQLVIDDPWFAWLHSLSELVVRIDETVEPDAPATMADAAALLAQVDRLLTASESGEGFARRYFDALQRQPAVVLAHADVKRVLKSART